MSDPNSFQDGRLRNHTLPYSQSQSDQQQIVSRAQQNEFLNYRFSPEELQVIRECEIESFYNRSLPFSFVFGTATYFAVQKGFLKPNVKFGPWPKVIAYSLFGYIAGRLSYTKKCQEKMMALPNSRFAEMLRQKKQGKNWELGSHDAGAATALSLAPFQGATDSYSDEFNKPNSLNLDTSRPHYSGLDDYTPTMEGTNDLNEDLAIPTRKNTITYDELRQKNRDEFARNNYSSYSRASPPASPPPPINSVPEPNNAISTPFNAPTDIDRRRANMRARNETEFSQQAGPKNKYGDIWSE